MRELMILFAILSLSVACTDRTEAPQQDPMAPFFRQEVGPPCTKNSDCATGLCDRLLIPVDGMDEAQGACSSVPFAVFAWQRAILVGKIVDAIGDNEDLRDRVLTFAAAALEAPDAPISLRILALELTEKLLPGLTEAWEDRLASLKGEWNLPKERMLAGLILAGRDTNGAAFRDLEAAAALGPEVLRIRAARELAALCLPAAVPTLVELASSRESRFVRAAVVAGVSGCDEPLRRPVMDAAAADAMPYERAQLQRLGLEAAGP